MMVGIWLKPRCIYLFTTYLCMYLFRWLCLVYLCIYIRVLYVYLCFGWMWMCMDACVLVACMRAWYRHMQKSILYSLILGVKIYMQIKIFLLEKKTLITFGIESHLLMLLRWNPTPTWSFSTLVDCNLMQVRLPRCVRVKKGFVFLLSLFY